MATESIHMNVVIKDKQAGERLADALERAANTLSELGHKQAQEPVAGIDLLT